MGIISIETQQLHPESRVDDKDYNTALVMIRRWEKYGVHLSCRAGKMTTATQRR